MAHRAAASLCPIRHGRPEASAERRGAGPEAEVTAEARRRDGDGGVGGRAVASGLCGSVRAAQVSRGATGREEVGTGGARHPRELEEENKPWGRAQARWAWRTSPSTGSCLEGLVVESADWGLLDPRARVPEGQGWPRALHAGSGFSHRLLS